MAYQSNTQQQRERLERLRILVQSGAVSDALVAGLNAGMAAMKRRIFNQSLAVDGSGLGKYFSDQYERDRQREGRQVANKDLEFTGTLRRSIEVVTINNSRAEIRFTDGGSADIARWQEQQIYNLRNNLPANEASGGKVPIFALNTLETSIVQTTTRALIQQRFQF